MTAPLRVLHVEDSANDAELVAAALATEGIVCTIQRVETAAALEAALDGGLPDLVLADYSLPGFDGMRALHAVRARADLLPFIMVTGTIGEERAVDAMKQGATDFVLKHRLERLGPAVRRALAEVEQRRQREAAEHALRASEAELRSTFEAAPVGLVVLERGGRIRRANAALATMLRTGEAELVGGTLHAWVDPAERAAAQAGLERLFADGVFEGPVERQYRAADGELVWVRCTAALIHASERLGPVLAVLEDITLRKREADERELLETQLRQAQKMEAVGQLTGGIAHDFNNVLTVMMASAELAQRDLPADLQAIRDDLEMLIRAGRRGRDLVSKMLGFSRRQALLIRPLVAGQFIDEFARTLRRVLPSHIALETEVTPGLPPMLADAGSLEQMLFNLATNARDAMPQGGRLRIRVTEGAPPHGAEPPDPGARPRFLAFQVTDSGIGMDDATRARIFEPFFTTKPVGVGTGLGMAMIYGLARQQRGAVDVVSAPGAGTTVTLYLPVYEGALPVRDLTPVPPSPRATVPLRGTALVAEDEASIRRVATRVLEGLGLKVVAVDSGSAALAALSEAVPIDLVVSDYMMPDLTGLDLYQRLRAQGHTAHFIITTGYSAEEVSTTGFGPEVRRLAKPWSIADLTNAVRELLTPA